MKELKGIDISDAQGAVNWDAVSGIDFAMIRAGYGKNHADRRFARNVRACSRLDIPCGVYWSSGAVSESQAQKEAEACLAAVKPYRVELPIAFDREYNSCSPALRTGPALSMEQTSAVARAFCETVGAAGHTPAVYAKPGYFGRFYDDSVLRYPLWLAGWSPTPPAPDTGHDIWLWQYGLTTVPGFSAPVDGDVGYKTPAGELISSVSARIGLNSPEYWLRVLHGQTEADPLWVKAVLRKTCAALGVPCGDGMLVDRATALLGLNFPAYWHAVAAGNLIPSAENMKALFQKIDAAGEPDRTELRAPRNSAAAAQRLRHRLTK
jgi:GH25 family lysozyme M1 (1,4-beta-N-acetylmuramidase)